MADQAPPLSGASTEGSDELPMELGEEGEEDEPKPLLHYIREGT